MYTFGVQVGRFQRTQKSVARTETMTHDGVDISNVQNPLLNEVPTFVQDGVPNTIKSK